MNLAGHLPILRLRDRKIEMLSESNLPLGIVPDSRFRAISCEMLKGDVLVVVTDGLTEVAGKDGEEHGFRWISEALIAHGIRFEFSHFQMYKENCAFYRCAIDNAIVRYGGLLAIPVTTLPNRFHSKLDVNTRTASELVAGIEALPVSVIFLHSMSLLKPWRGSTRLSEVDSDAIHNCQMALAHVVTDRMVSLDTAGIAAREEELIKLTYSSDVENRLKSVRGQQPSHSRTPRTRP